MKEICGLTLEEAKYVIKQNEYFLVDEIVQSAGRVLIEEIDKLKSREQKLIEKLEADKMKEFDDCVIYLLGTYLKILKGENDE